MALQPPKKSGGSYELAITPPVASPRLQCNGAGEWTPNTEWVTWASEQQQQRIGELIEHANWFSRPPRREIIEPLFTPWVGKAASGEVQIFCKKPGAPSAGSAVWNLCGLTMSASAITPLWTLTDFVENQDTISLFGDAPESDDEQQTREIHFDEIAIASPEQGPTRMRNREWDASKFLAKERVRESRLKAQIAEHLARKEEARFYSKYGELDETESHFSDYDLSEEEEEPSDSPVFPGIN